MSLSSGNVDLEQRVDEVLGSFTAKANVLRKKLDKGGISASQAIDEVGP